MALILKLSFLTRGVNVLIPILINYNLKIFLHLQTFIPLYSKKCNFWNFSKYCRIPYYHLSKLLNYMDHILHWKSTNFKSQFPQNWVFMSYPCFLNASYKRIIKNINPCHTHKFRDKMSGDNHRINHIKFQYKNKYTIIID